MRRGRELEPALRRLPGAVSVLLTMPWCFGVVTPSTLAALAPIGKPSTSPLAALARSPVPSPASARRGDTPVPWRSTWRWAATLPLSRALSAAAESPPTPMACSLSLLASFDTVEPLWRVTWCRLLGLPEPSALVLESSSALPLRSRKSRCGVRTAAIESDGRPVRCGLATWRGSPKPSARAVAAAAARARIAICACSS